MVDTEAPHGPLPESSRSTLCWRVFHSRHPHGFWRRVAFRTIYSGSRGHRAGASPIRRAVASAGDPRPVESCRGIAMDVTVYTTPTCPYCRMAKDYLTQ